MPKVEDVSPLIDRMAEELKTRLGNTPADQTAMIGILTGGVWVAKRLHQKLGIRQPLGQLNISFYRDDFSRIGMHPQVTPSSLPFNVDNAHIILVDDVLHTGRTIRAALNEIFDYGRPASVTLAVLAERSGRELPIQADVVGAHLKLSAREHAKLAGPDQLVLQILEAP